MGESITCLYAKEGVPQHDVWRTNSYVYNTDIWVCASIGENICVNVCYFECNVKTSGVYQVGSKLLFGKKAGESVLAVALICHIVTGIRLLLYFGLIIT